MAFKGVIRVGSTVEVTLSADFSNSGTALLAAGSGTIGAAALSQSTTVASGGTATLTLTPGGPGLLQILVDMADDDDSGMLAIKVDGRIKTSDPIQGDTQWTYSVQAAVAPANG